MVVVVLVTSPHGTMRDITQPSPEEPSSVGIIQPHGEQLLTETTQASSNQITLQFVHGPGVVVVVEVVVVDAQYTLHGFGVLGVPVVVVASVMHPPTAHAPQSGQDADGTPHSQDEVHPCLASHPSRTRRHGVLAKSQTQRQLPPHVGGGGGGSMGGTTHARNSVWHGATAG